MEKGMFLPATLRFFPIRTNVILVRTDIKRRYYPLVILHIALATRKSNAPNAKRETHNHKFNCEMKNTQRKSMSA